MPRKKGQPKKTSHTDSKGITRDKCTAGNDKTCN